MYIYVCMYDCTSVYNQEKTPYVYKTLHDLINFYVF